MNLKIVDDNTSKDSMIKHNDSSMSGQLSEALDAKSEIKTDKIKGEKIKRSKKKVPEQGAPFNEVERTIFERRSVRVFKEKQLPDYLVKRILEAGRYAPNAGNCQSWKFVVVQDKNMIEEMTERVVKLAGWTSRLMNPAFPKAIVGNRFSHFMMKRFTGMFHPTGITGLGQLAKKELGLWHGAPTVIFLLVDERGTGDPHLDIGIVGTNMVLTAHSFGLGTCWVSFSTLLEMSPKFKKYLGIEFPYRLATSIAIGYPKGIPDGMVERETHETVWYNDDGDKRIEI